MAKVLIVDDESAVASLLKLVIEDSGHEAQVAHDGIEALALARQSPPDLVISDIMMPRMTGTELLAAIRLDPLLDAVPVILISAAVGPPNISREVTIYLRKPFELHVLEDLMNRLIGPAPAQT